MTSALYGTYVQMCPRKMDNFRVYENEISVVQLNNISE